MSRLCNLGGSDFSHHQSRFSLATRIPSHTDLEPVRELDTLWDDKRPRDGSASATWRWPPEGSRHGARLGPTISWLRGFGQTYSR